MIKIENLSKVFRTEEVETVALNGVNMQVSEGEFVAIMGPSGCGKSTLLNILGLLDNPTDGSYMLLGQEVAKLKEKDRTKFRKGNIGFVFQSFNLIDELNVYENVELPLKYLNISFTGVRDISPVQDVAMERFNCMGNKIGADAQNAYTAAHPDCIALFAGKQPYGYGWRYIDDGYNFNEYYKTMRLIFHYDEESLLNGYAWDEATKNDPW